jgi:hypothetical protein
MSVNGGAYNFGQIGTLHIDTPQIRLFRIGIKRAHALCITELIIWLIYISIPIGRVGRATWWALLYKVYRAVALV